MSPDANMCMDVYQDGQRAFNAGTNCPYAYTDWRAATWQKGFVAARAYDAGFSKHGKHRLNGDASVAVSTDVFWNEDMATCPRGVKVQLLGAGGVALYGTYDGRDPFYVGWAPLPRRK